MRLKSLFLCWVLASVATAGSLFFSEVMNFPPCVLCWYQRICMYPLVLIFAVGFLRDDKEIFFYSFPLAVTGLGIAIYHNLLYYKILPESAAPCREGISCTTVFFELLGFITIPSLSLFAFTLITALLLFIRKSHEK